MVSVSVIMPVYNTAESYLRDAVSSVLAQSFTDFEFLILNDSPDNRKLKNIVLSYNDKRIKYFENPYNMGIPQSYNKLLELASGKYVAVMNHDDIMLNSRISTQYTYLEKHPEIVLLGSWYKKFGEINRFKVVKNPRSHEEICACLLFKSSLHHPTIMMRRDIIELHKIRYNENYISLNDRILCYDFSKYGRLENLPQILYKYRFHKNMTSKAQKDIIRKERAMFHKLWFAGNNIELDADEIDVFDNYTTCGRNKITDKTVLLTALRTLEKLSEINKSKNILSLSEFDKVCSKYYFKRCLGALIYGKINLKSNLSSPLLKKKEKFLLRFLNIFCGWK